MAKFFSQKKSTSAKVLTFNKDIYEPKLCRVVPWQGGQTTLLALPIHSVVCTKRQDDICWFSGHFHYSTESWWVPLDIQFFVKPSKHTFPWWNVILFQILCCLIWSGPFPNNSPRLFYCLVTRSTLTPKKSVICNSGKYCLSFHNK